jgi:hypothetical protein
VLSFLRGGIFDEGFENNDDLNWGLIDQVIRIQICTLWGSNGLD